MTTKRAKPEPTRRTTRASVPAHRFGHPKPWTAAETDALLAAYETYAAGIRDWEYVWGYATSVEGIRKNTDRPFHELKDVHRRALQTFPTPESLRDWFEHDTVILDGGSTEEVQNVVLGIMRDRGEHMWTQIALFMEGGDREWSEYKNRYFELRPPAPIVGLKPVSDQELFNVQDMRSIDFVRAGLGVYRDDAGNVSGHYKTHKILGTRKDVHEPADRPRHEPWYVENTTAKV